MKERVEIRSESDLSVHIALSQPPEAVLTKEELDPFYGLYEPKRQRYIAGPGAGDSCLASGSEAAFVGGQYVLLMEGTGALHPAFLLRLPDPP